MPLSYTVPCPVPYTDRSHAVEFLTGSRVCDFDDASVRCAQLRSRGGWGPTAPGQDEVPIPNLNVHFLNNIIANPPDNTTKWNHMEVGRRGGRGTAGGRLEASRLRTSRMVVGCWRWFGQAVGHVAHGVNTVRTPGGDVADHTGVARL